MAEFAQRHEEITGQPCTLDQAYHLYRKESLELYESRIREAIERGDNIILERPYNSPELRRDALSVAKSSRKFHYKTTAIVIASPDEETHIKRLVDRAAKETRYDALSYVSLNKMPPPRAGDGEFDEVITLGTHSERPLFHEYAEPGASLADRIRQNAAPGISRAKAQR